MIHECTANYSTRIGNPWKPTSQIIKANKVLNDMFNSLDSDSPLKKFLRDHCSHLLDLDFNDPTVVTGSSATTLTSHSVKGGKDKGHPAKYFGLAGVYVFQCSTTGAQYIGSAIGLYIRYKAHMVNSTRPNRGGNSSFYQYVRQAGGWTNFTWGPVITFPNYLMLFGSTVKGSISPQDALILRAFTEYQVRIYEQALFNQFKPRLNGGHLVNFSFLNWEPGKSVVMSDGLTTEAWDKDGNLIQSFDSRYAAASGLGIPRVSLQRYLNLSLHSIFSPTLEMDVYIVDPNLPMSDAKPSGPTQTDFGPIQGVDLEALPMGSLFALLEDKETIYAKYATPGEAAKADGKSDNKYIRRYINLERLVTLSNGTTVYFVMNPEWFNSRLRVAPQSPRNTKGVVVVDTLATTHTALEFDTVRDVLAWLGMARSSWGSTGFLKRYINPVKLYKNRYEFYYTQDYKDVITGKGPTAPK